MIFQKVFIKAGKNSYQMSIFRKEVDKLMESKKTAYVNSLEQDKK
ncbi:MAG: hypothetical protein ABFC98_05390 [Candidatus Cloacimonas sp.]